MADCHNLFETFHGKIKVAFTRKEKLRTSRNATRERIRKHFSETMNVTPPKFHGQGSYSMNTLVNPIDGLYDIDDGVYLQNLDEDRSTWPTAATVHGWLMDATRDSTDIPPRDRDRCVRVIYKATPPYHIDLPVYVMVNGVPQLFDKSREGASQSPVSPYESDPRAITGWFKEHVDDENQLRRLVRYTKAWKDNKKTCGTGVAKGLMLTILISETFVTDACDDVALSNTVNAANDRMKRSMVVRKPVTPFEDLTSGWTKTQSDAFLESLQQFRDRAADAIAESDKAKAAKIWQKLFGDRFPDAEPEDDNKKERALRTSAPTILGNDGRSA